VTLQNLGHRPKKNKKNQIWFGGVFAPIVALAKNGAKTMTNLLNT